MRIRRSAPGGKHALAIGLALSLLGGWAAPFTPQAHAEGSSLWVGAALAAASTTSTPVAAVELSPTPPNDTQGVAPNIVVTFDDSGSMANNYMGDNRPFDNGSWSGPWRCAGVINPNITSSSDVRSSAMNGVYYNPNVRYVPPVKADGSSFPDADPDGTLMRVPVDGIGINRPYLPIKLDAVGGYNNNPNGAFDSSAATNLTGTKTTMGPSTGWYWTGTGDSTDYKNTWVYGTYPSGSGLYSTNSKNTRPSRTSDTRTGAYPTVSLGDKRWTCGYDSTSPMDSSKKGPDGNYYPDGGPYYYRLKSSVSIAVDKYGHPTTGTGGGLNALYNASNWEAVAVPNTDTVIGGVSINQWRNFANWYAYYRSRNQMTRTSLSRVFGGLGSANSSGGYGNPFRVAWQNLYTSDTFYLQANTIISALIDTNSPSKCDASSVDPATVGLKSTAPLFQTPPACYRSAFFNWIFGVNATDTTPARAAAIRAGQFFQRGNGNTGSSGDLHDPYWEPPVTAGADGLELVCRQNFHMLVTDGYWNENNPTLPTTAQNAGTPFRDGQTAVTLPDGTAYSVTAAESRVFWNVQGTKLQSSQANIAFNYWATNLRPDLYPSKGKVPAYMPDTSTGVISSATSADLEKYFNPKNDPAVWPHMVEYMVTLGVPGKLTYSDDVDCSSTTANDICDLRRGNTNSSGAAGWPTPSNNNPTGIDDTWHAAVNSRGAYFNAANPQNLVDQMSTILTNISARSAPALAGAVNTSVLVPGALAFSTGYSTADWSGQMQAVAVNSDGSLSTAPLWDAGALLDDAATTPPASRKIFTAKEGTDGSFAGGINFSTFTDMDPAGQSLLSGTPASAGASDTGQNRLDYLRGVRTNEGTTFRTRAHLLGAIIGSQALYVSYPASGYRSTWPTGAPENDTATCANGSTPTCHSYEYFVNAHLTRKPVVYVGANDGMLHAFDASQQDSTTTPGTIEKTADSGKELFAYVPRSVYGNLGAFTSKSNFTFMPTVDGQLTTRDVYFSADTTSPTTTSQGWHTLLVGSLRLGGRGVYALDVTDPTSMSSSKVLWEFNADQPDQPSWNDDTATNPGGKPSNLGYTFGQPNIGRLPNGKWVVLVAGGYFPDCSKAPFTSANCTYPAAASNKYSSLFILDAQTGKLIREMTTPDPDTVTGAVASHGLATPVLGDYNDDQVDDVAFAGDLDGNVWRFDLSSADPSQWSVRLLFQPATVGAQPITSMPRLFPDPVSNRFMVVFGTGKYLGTSDNTSGSAATQAVYGIRDNSTTAWKVSDLIQQTLSEATSTDGTTVARGLTNYAVPASKGGWYFNLGPTDSSQGERVVVTPGALFDTGRAVIQTLIPGTNDPCSASIQGALMVVDASTGGSGGGLAGPLVSNWGGSRPSDTSVVGGRVDNPRTSGSVPLVTTIGGGNILIPGLKLSGGNVLNINDAIWRRRSWRQVDNQ